MLFNPSISVYKDAGKDWRQKKRATEDEKVGWHHRFNGHELGQTLGAGEGWRGLEFCCSWGRKESEKTWWLNNNIVGGLMRLSQTEPLEQSKAYSNRYYYIPSFISLFVCKGEVLFIRRNKQHGLPRQLSDKESTCQRRRCKRYAFNPCIRRSPGGENGSWLQYSCLENSMNRGTWWATVHGFMESPGHDSAHTHNNGAYYYPGSSDLSRLLGGQAINKKITYKKKPFESWKAL